MSSVSIQRLWWLHPAWLFALINGSTIALAISQSEQNYLLYNTPKYINAYHGLLAIGVILAFMVGCNLALLTGQTPKQIPKQSMALLKSSVHGLFGLTIFGYMVWLFIGIKNGFSLSLIRDVLFGDDAGMVYEVATDVFQNISGVTTCTQFAIAAIPLGVWLYSTGYRQVAWLIGFVLAIAFFRAFILSERISLVELVVPATIVFVRQYMLNRKIPEVMGWCLTGAPFLGVLVLLLFFGSAEYFRSWKLYQKDFDSVAEFTVWRISGYYTTSHNNSAMVLETNQKFALPYFTIQSLWLFPGVPKSPFGYKNLTGQDPEQQHFNILEKFATEELNNYGGLFAPAFDFGIIGLFVYWFGCGFAAGKLYRCYRVGSIAGITLYPLVFLSILEVPRFLYIPNQRVFPSLIAIIGIIWLVSRQAQPANSTVVELSEVAPTVSS